MKTTISPEIERNPGLAAAITRANDVLRGELGGSESLVSTSWRLGQDPRLRPVVDLVISHPDDSVSGQFALHELTRNGDRLQSRLRLLWDDLLQARSIRRMERIKRLVEQLEGD